VLHDGQPRVEMFDDVVWIEHIHVECCDAHGNGAVRETTAGRLRFTRATISTKRPRCGRSHGDGVDPCHHEVPPRGRSREMARETD
jgi:hypothetical protein